VDELRKPAGVDCLHQRGTRGCAIHPTRPDICRRYRCLWLQGGLEDDERPDATGGVVDLEATGIGLRLGIRMARGRSFEQSPALRAIAERYRNEMPVRVSDVEDVMDADRPFRILLADGIEQRVAGERIEILRDGELVERRVLPWAERWMRRLSIRWRNHKLHRLGRGDRS
jgi:Fe-S-cluster containining protein